MFTHLKNKTKDAKLRIWSRSADSTMLAQQPQTFSMADMPLKPQTIPTAVLPDQGPQPYAQEQTKSTGTKQPAAKKSLNFSEPSDMMEQIVVADMAVQTPMTEATNAAEGAVGSVQAGTFLQIEKV